MVRIQVQIPDALYHEAQRIAKEREMPFAEVVREGLEYMAKAYPACEVRKNVPTLPIGPDVQFVDDFDQLDLRQILADEESERSLPRDER